MGVRIAPPSELSWETPTTVRKCGRFSTGAEPRSSSPKNFKTLWNGYAADSPDPDENYYASKGFQDFTLSNFCLR